MEGAIFTMFNTSAFYLLFPGGNSNNVHSDTLGFHQIQPPFSHAHFGSVTCKQARNLQFSLAFCISGKQEVKSSASISVNSNELNPGVSAIRPFPI